MKSIVLESAKAVNGGKVQLTFSQLVERENTSTNILGQLNASDERFNKSKPRYAWLSAEPADVKTLFGIDTASLAVGEEIVLDMVDPRLSTAPETPLNIEISETTKGNEYEVANIAKTAKRAGKDGDYILTADDQYIFVRTTVVAGPANHKLIKETKRLTVSPLASILD